MNNRASDLTITPEPQNVTTTIVEQAITGASAGAFVGSFGGLGVAIAGAIVGAIVNNGDAIRQAFAHTDPRE